VKELYFSQNEKGTGEYNSIVSEHLHNIENRYKTIAYTEDLIVHAHLYDLISFV
jgi:hypothetical protein